MSKTHHITSLAALIVLATACGGDYAHPDTSNCKVEAELDPFYKEIFRNDGEDLTQRSQRLTEKYGDYYIDYCKKEMRLGAPTDSTFEEAMNLFLSQRENKEVIAACDSIYEKYGKKESTRLSDALSCFKYYFPEIGTPKTYLHMSGFNNKMFMDSAYLSISIEHFLGSGCRFYEWLETPVYARKNKEPWHISRDAMKAWIYGNLPELSGKEDILTELIYQGRVLYVLGSCMPDMKKNELLGMTEQELEWCEVNEANMWGFMAERKLLYSTNPLDKNKLTHEAPFTSFFGENSPGRAALYCGYNIVRSYMKEHKETTLKELMEIVDAQELLIEAHYIP